MFANQMQIMLYVEDVPKSVAFWQSLGFEIQLQTWFVGNDFCYFIG